MNKREKESREIILKKDNLFFICLKLSEYSEQHRAYLGRFCTDLNVIYPIFITTLTGHI